MRMETNEQVLARIEGIRVTFSDIRHVDELEQEYGTRWFRASGKTRDKDEIELIDEHGKSAYFFASGRTWSIVPYINVEEELDNL